MSKKPISIDADHGAAFALQFTHSRCDDVAWNQLPIFSVVDLVTRGGYASALESRYDIRSRDAVGETSVNSSLAEA